MNRTKNVRKDPNLFLPDVQSVIVTTVGYYQSGAEDTENTKTGKIARYATGRDYHKVIKKMLFRLVDVLQTEFFPNTSRDDFRISLDAHPVMERAWAQKSGIGFLGKNACLITEQAGSWVLIGCVLTTEKIPLKPSNYQREEANSNKNKKSDQNKLDFSQLSCGTCTRCIDYCPTRAIVAPGKIDARRCISYLTIENRGGIPIEFREAMGDRLFGCDICQEVCPFNIPRQSEPDTPMMEKQIVGTEILISEILEIENDQQFLDRFAGSPLMRAKRRGLVRNACVVAGNLKNTKLLPLLTKIVQSEKDHMLREHAQWAIAKITEANAV